MKRLWLILPVLLASLVYSQSKMDINNLIDRGGLLYAPNKEKPFSGSVFDFYDNGQKKLNGRYRNGLKNGKWTWWNEEGVVDRTGSYKNGLMHGQWEFYFSNGNLIGRGKYRDGDGSDRGNTGIPRHGRHGKWTFWYKNGQKKEEGTYKNVEPGIWYYLSNYWDKNGDIMVKDGNGLRTDWYENGQKKAEGTYKNEILNGLWTFWYENGQKQAEGTYKNEILNGLWIFWLQDGKESFEIIYKDGELWDGLELLMYTSSKLKGRVNTYKDGEMISQECWDYFGDEKECD